MQGFSTSLTVAVSNIQVSADADSKGEGDGDESTVEDKTVMSMLLAAGAAVDLHDGVS